MLMSGAEFKIILSKNPSDSWAQAFDKLIGGLELASNTRSLGIQCNNSLIDAIAIFKELAKQAPSEKL